MTASAEGHTVLRYPRERGDPEIPLPQVSHSRSALTTLDARVRGHDKVGSCKVPSSCSNPLKTLKTAMGRPCNELA